MKTFCLWLIVCSISFGGAAWSGPKSKSPKEQIKTLLEDKRYQQRMRAAYELAKFKGTEVQSTLLRALDDPHEGVRAAVLKTLAKVGDASVIGVLKKRRDANHVVRQEMQRTIVLLEERFPRARAKVDWGTVKGVIEIGALTNKSAIKRSTLLPRLRTLLEQAIRMQPDLAAADNKNGLKALEKEIAEHNLKPLVLMVNIKSLNKRLTGAETVWETDISITVFDHPDRWIKATLRNSGSSSKPKKEYAPNQDEALQELALKNAVQLAMEDLAQRLGRL